MRTGFIARPRNAMEVLWNAIMKISIISSRIFPNKPGAVIESMCQSDRDVLKELSSNDTSKDNVPNIYLGDDKYYECKKISAELLEFDKKLKK
jgi:hypothetical protein